MLAKIEKFRGGQQTRIRDIEWTIGKEFKALSYVAGRRSNNGYNELLNITVDEELKDKVRSIHKDYRSALIRAWVSEGYSQYQQFGIIEDRCPHSTTTPREIEWLVDKGFIIISKRFNPTFGVDAKNLLEARNFKVQINCNIDIKTKEKLRKLGRIKNPLLRSWLQVGLDDFNKLEAQFLKAV